MARKQLFYVHANAEGSRGVDVGPTDKDTRAYVRTGSERGMYSSTTPTVMIEGVNAKPINRVVTHVSLVDERSGGKIANVLKLVGRQEARDGEDTWDVGAWFETPGGRLVDVREGLAMLDRYMDLVQTGRVDRDTGKLL